MAASAVDVIENGAGRERARPSVLGSARFFDATIQGPTMGATLESSMLQSTRAPRAESRLSAGGKRPAAFDLKGTMAPLTVLRLHATDIALIERQLRVKIAQMPQLFIDAPVLLDLGALADGGAGLALGALVPVLRQCKLVPVAASNVPDGLRAGVLEAGLGILQPQVGARPARGEGDGGDATPAEPLTLVAPPPAVAPALPAGGAAAPLIARAAGHGGPVVVSQPVRGGQVVYAQNNDLVVLAPVNPGAQVIADGHVHIYAPLRGRAVAGAQGLLGARIFCQKLEAELVAISGAYVMADEIPADRRGKPAQIYLDGGECRIAAL
jgi:septum site-determining protein MinC